MDSNRHSRARLLDGATAAAVMSMTTVVIGASDVTDHRDNDRHSSGSVITHTHTHTHGLHRRADRLFHFGWVFTWAKSPMRDEQMRGHDEHANAPL